MSELTPAETRALDLSRDLWNAFIALPILNPAEQDETMRDIHNIQNRILSRQFLRDDAKEKVLVEALTIVRDSDDERGKASLPILPLYVRNKIDAALAPPAKSAGPCPDCRSTNTRFVNGGAVCDACGFDATPPDDEEF
jgi:hypothetical protein